MRTATISMALVVLSVIAPGRRPPAQDDRPFTASTQVADQPVVLITEVMFAPAPGDTAFVELGNVGSVPVDLSSMVLRIDTLVFPLPRLAEPLAPGGRFLIRFDGRALLEGTALHTSPGLGLNAEGGTVYLLRNDDFVLDWVAWGTAEGAIQPSTGGFTLSIINPGSSFGRPPGANRPGAATDWVLYPPGQPTPGRANPTPAVLQLLPLDGAILEGSQADLGWYPVPGAVSYRVQLASDTAFGQTLLDQTVSEPDAGTGQLPAGVYGWRVQAIGPDGPAAWSRPSRIELGDQGVGQGGGSPPGFSPSDDGDPGPATTRVPVPLDVPYLAQHKDTRMLLLESLQEGTEHTWFMLPKPPHTWDGDHGTLDRQDKADNMNCGLASMAMINHFYGGDLSQDRIGYEMFSRNVTKYVGRVDVRSIRAPGPTELREQAPGPEFDLNYGLGLSNAQMLAEGLYALGTLPGPGSGYTSRDNIWSLVVKEIDAGRPLMGYNCCHLFVIRGYELRGTRRLLYINDPWSGRYGLDLDAGRSPIGQMKGVLAYPSPPAVAHQEPSVTTDSDKDGVVDFDEINRFHTDPNNKDSDTDGVPDKQDIASGIYEFDHHYGYALKPVPNSPGRDYDRDGIPTELDRDSDNGGCMDGEEDADRDGIRNGAETSNFDETDDMCGNLQGNLSYLQDLVSNDTNQIIQHIHDQGVILVRLKPKSPGSDHYVDNGSTFTYEGFARIEIPDPQCTIWGREESHGSGRFTGDAEIGATRGNDGTLALGAGADVPGQSATGGCGIGGGGAAQRRLSFPDCEGKLTAARGGPPGELTYRFNCTTKPDAGSQWTVTEFYARGFVRVK